MRDGDAGNGDEEALPAREMRWLRISARFGEMRDMSVWLGGEWYSARGARRSCWRRMVAYRYGATQVDGMVGIIASRS